MLTAIPMPTCDCERPRSPLAPKGLRGLGEYDAGTITGYSYLPNPKTGLCTVYAQFPEGGEQVVGIQMCPPGMVPELVSQPGLIAAAAATQNVPASRSVATPVKVSGDQSGRAAVMPPAGPPLAFDPAAGLYPPDELVAETGAPSRLGVPAGETVGTQVPAPAKPFPWLTLALLAGSLVLGG